MLQIFERKSLVKIMQDKKLMISALVICAAIFAGCSGRPATDGPGTGASAGLVKVDGSSTLFPVTEAVAEEFQNSQKGNVRVTVGISGTGGGFKKFGRGEIDVVNASRPILAEEMELARSNGVEYIELTVAFDGMAIVVHPENDWCDCITVEQLKSAPADSLDELTKDDGRAFRDRAFQHYGTKPYWQ